MAVSVQFDFDVSPTPGHVVEYHVSVETSLDRRVESFTGPREQNITFQPPIEETLSQSLNDLKIRSGPQSLSSSKSMFRKRLRASSVEGDSWAVFDRLCSSSSVALSMVRNSPSLGLFPAR